MANLPLFSITILNAWMKFFFLSNHAFFPLSWHASWWFLPLTLAHHSYALWTSYHQLVPDPTLLQLEDGVVSRDDFHNVRVPSKSENKIKFNRYDSLKNAISMEDVGKLSWPSKMPVHQEKNGTPLPSSIVLVPLVQQSLDSWALSKQFCLGGHNYPSSPDDESCESHMYSLSYRILVQIVRWW